jgi:uncharacterized protein YxeA
MINKKIGFTFMAVMMVAVVILTLTGGWRPARASAEMVMDQEYEGFLIKAHSSNEQDDPSKITKENIQMPECATSGYGISVKQTNGKYQFFKFDENGQKLAKEILTKTTKASGIVIIIKGTLDGDTLKVTTLTEKIIQPPVIVELTGWLIEKSCSGTDDPAKHTKECCLMKDCAASGYGITVKQPDGSFKFYKFDQKGHNLAAAYLKKTNKKDNLTISVKGFWDGEILKVTSFAENN